MQKIAVLTGPALIVFLAFVIFPVVMAAYYGFFSWKGYGPPTDFVGLHNYKIILTDPTFHDAVRHNFTIVVLSLVMQGPIAIGLALLLNRKMRVPVGDPGADLRALRDLRGRRRYRLEPDAPDQRCGQRPAREARAGRAQAGLAVRPEASPSGP